MTIIIYNCKRCKVGKRVEYPLGSAGNGAHRLNADGKPVPAGIYITRCGGGKPTEYAGDVEFGICPHCNKMMAFGVLKAYLRPECPCDARCTNARGHNCECSCGGQNHGTGR